MMPTVEINMEHNHRTSRETCHQKSVRKKSVLFCVISLAVLFLTFDHAIRPRTGFHYHKLGMHKVGPNWTSSKPRQYRGHLQKSGIHRRATSPSTEIDYKICLKKSHSGKFYGRTKKLKFLFSQIFWSKFVIKYFPWIKYSKEIFHHQIRIWLFRVKNSVFRFARS